ncbi:MAG TPA: DUF4139 domain-containing protein [Candidatus Brocadiia bacterium]|nr:DUF4139 domain-containing protein [Candidatus Brocadiia bacterium]
MKKLTAIVVVVLALCVQAMAEVDLVTLPSREGVQLTIYNSADLTLVRDVRNLTLKEGINRLSFSWANTLIDPTSLDLRALKNEADVDLLGVSYPPRLQQIAVWDVQSRIAGEVPVEITFFTSGISWRAFYMATLSPDEATMLLKGYVRVTNNSGEDYEKAQTRLIVGKINLLDEIAMLSQRYPPYGSPADGGYGGGAERDDNTVGGKRRELMKKAKGAMDMPAAAPAPTMVADSMERPKEIKKEGLAEYFIYTIEGTETIPNTWSKRLPSFDQGDIPVENLYKYDENRWGNEVIRFLYFKNDKKHKLGETPLPDGLVKVYRTADEAGGLSYEGACDTKYIPVDQKAELDLGPARQVSVEPKLMAVKKENFTYDNDKNIDGWDDIETWQIEVKNQRPVAARLEITMHLRHQHCDVKNEGDCGEYKKDDLVTTKYTLNLEPRSARKFGYTLTYREGRRQQ